MQKSHKKKKFDWVWTNSIFPGVYKNNSIMYIYYADSFDKSSETD